MSTKQFTVIVFGVDRDQKSHAARFNPEDADTAMRAAHLMGLKVGRAESDTAISLAKELAEGKIFATGKALVPYVKQELLDKLAPHLTLLDVTEMASTAQELAKPEAGTDPWSAVNVGSVVVCLDTSEAEAGWWEAVVIGIGKDGEMLTLRWRDYPEFPKFTASRHAVALLAGTKPSAI